MSFRRLFVQARKFCKRTFSVGRSSPPILTAAFGKYIFFTNTATCGILMGLGDIVQQEIEFRNKILNERYDWARLGRMLVVGFLFGPPHHYFYKYMDHFIPQRNVLGVTKKILLDQLLMSPFSIVIFFYGMGMMEKKSTKECTEELSSKFAEVYMMDWIIWPPTQFINFYFLPVQYQVVYINVVTMFYNIFLSFIKHKEVAEEPNILKRLFKQNSIAK